LQCTQWSYGATSSDEEVLEPFTSPTTGQTSNRVMGVLEVLTSISFAVIGFSRIATPTVVMMLVMMIDFI